MVRKGLCEMADSVKRVAAVGAAPGPPIPTGEGFVWRNLLYFQSEIDT